jgi:hypothetical protein
MRVKGVPNTVQLLHILAVAGSFVPGICLLPVVFFLPIMVLTGQVSWGDCLSLLVALLVIAFGIAIPFIASIDLQQVIDAYSVLDDLRSEIAAKDRDTLTDAERKVLQFYHHGTYWRF